MKRSEALKPLSHEHHQALYVAKVIRDAATLDEAQSAFFDYWGQHGSRHFQIEEEVLLPGSGLAGPSADQDVARLHDEHLDIRRRVSRAASGESSLDDLKQLGEALYDHVRFEERDLFPRIEAGLDPEQLQRLAEAIEKAEAS